MDIFDQAQAHDELFRKQALAAQLNKARPGNAPLATQRDCVDCGEPIPAKRLEVNPAAIRCVRCQAKAERDNVDDE